MEEKEPVEQLEETVPTKKKGVSPVTIILGVIIVALLVLISILAVPYIASKEGVDPDKPEPVPVEEKYTDLSVDDELVTEALGFIPSRMCGGLFFEFPETSITINEFTSVQKLNMVVSLYEMSIIKTAADNSTWELNESDLDRYFADLSFMDEFKPVADTSYDAQTGKPGIEGANGVNDSIIPFYFRYENGKYAFGSYGAGCIGPGNNGYYIEKESAKKSDKELLVTVGYYYREAGDWDGESEMTYNYYRTKGDSAPIDKNNKEEYDHYEISYNIENDKLQLKGIRYVG